ncbi:Golgin 84 [Paratrimastix pyriformis]|uniref:Golgin 84 n=1 Tax=Paratrimastix pyriformis TaxID=342808 RepID=A0ABQ8UE72_9EUKA|nr:Golgin 84 [Paratrimastix pyriformis]
MSGILRWAEKVLENVDQKYAGKTGEGVVGTERPPATSGGVDQISLAPPAAEMSFSSRQFQRSGKLMATKIPLSTTTASVPPTSSADDDAFFDALSSAFSKGTAMSAITEPPKNVTPLPTQPSSPLLPAVSPLPTSLVDSTTPGQITSADLASLFVNAGSADILAPASSPPHPYSAAPTPGASPRPPLPPEIPTTGEQTPRALDGSSSSAAAIPPSPTPSPAPLVPVNPIAIPPTPTNPSPEPSPPAVVPVGSQPATPRSVPPSPTPPLQPSPRAAASAAPPHSPASSPAPLPPLAPRVPPLALGTKAEAITPAAVPNNSAATETGAPDSDRGRKREPTPQVLSAHSSRPGPAAGRTETLLAEKTQLCKELATRLDEVTQLRSLQARVDELELDCQRQHSRMELLKNAFTAAKEETKASVKSHDLRPITTQALAVELKAARTVSTQQESDVSTERRMAQQQIVALGGALKALQSETALQINGWKASLKFLQQREQARRALLPLVLEGERAEMSRSVVAAQRQCDEQSHRMEYLEQRSRGLESELARARAELRDYRQRATAVLEEKDRQIADLQRAAQGDHPERAEKDGEAAQGPQEGAERKDPDPEAERLKKECHRLQEELASVRDIVRDTTEQSAAREQQLQMDLATARQRVAEIQTAAEREQLLSKTLTRDVAQKANQLAFLQAELEQERQRAQVLQQQVQQQIQQQRKKLLAIPRLDDRDDDFDEGCRGGTAEREMAQSRLRALSEQLLERQIQIETLSSEKASLQLMVEKLSRLGSAASSATSSATRKISMGGPMAAVPFPTPALDTVPPPGSTPPLVNPPLDDFTLLTSLAPMWAFEHPAVSRAICGNFDNGSEHTIHVLRRNPIMRVAVVLYVLFLQLYFIFSLTLRR